MARHKRITKYSAWGFVVILGCVSLFSDMTYEAARSITGPFLGLLGASALIVGLVSGLGELAGYAFRIVSGYFTDKSKRYWLVTFIGYGINLFAVPLLALAGDWVTASILIVLERFGKAVRVPSRDAMLSFAAKRTGTGIGFGINEALDQTGAVIGPVIVAAVLFMKKGDYHFAFGILLFPALIALVLLSIAKILFPRPEHLEIKSMNVRAKGFQKSYWLYLVAAIFIALGYADFPLIAYHFKKALIVSEQAIPLMYAAAMAADAIAALVFGFLYDRIGIGVLASAAFISAFFAPLVFLSGLFGAVIPACWAGVILWGIGMGAQESIMRSGIADMSPHDKRASAYGIFNTGFGVFWFLGSALMGFLYDTNSVALVIFSFAVQIVSIPVFIASARQRKRDLQERES
jgi:MFS family permease